MCLKPHTINVFSVSLNKSFSFHPAFRLHVPGGARCSSAVRALAHGVIDRRIDPSWGEPIELFLVTDSVTRLVYQRPWYVLSCL